MNIQPTTNGSPPNPAETAAVAARPAAAAPKAAAAPAPAAASQKAAAAVNPAELKSSVDAINRFLKVNSEVQFSIDDASGRSVIKVVDLESKKVLRQFPSEQALEIGKNLKGLKGLLVDSKA